MVNKTAVFLGIRGLDHLDPECHNNQNFTQIFSNQEPFNVRPYPSGTRQEIGTFRGDRQKMSAEEASLRELLFGAAKISDGRTDSDSARLAETSRIPENASPEIRALLHHLFRKTRPFYVTDSSGVLMCCSESFTRLSNRFMNGAGALAELTDAVRVAGREIKRSDCFNDSSSQWHFSSTHFPVYSDQGLLLGFGGVYEDVTREIEARNKATQTESWFQDIVRSSSDWIWAIDHNYNLSFVSPRISEILGEPPHILTGRHLFAMGDFTSNDPLAARTRQDMEFRAPFRGRHFVLKLKNGGERHVHLSAVPVFDDDSGAFRGYRGTGTDITLKVQSQKIIEESKARLEDTYAELRRSNEELRISLDHAKISESTKLEFLAMMSHELKTPLNSIIGFSDAALHRVHGPIVGPYADYFENIHTAGRHLMGIITSLLDMASLERQSPTIHPNRESVEHLIEEAVQLADPGSHSNDLDLTGLLPRTDLSVYCDHLRARQILINLVGNAMKFTPAKGRIGIDVESRPGGTVAITVWDTGIGIPAEKLARIFDKFYQVEENVPSRGGTGTGLGLSISRHLARLMGGDLTVASVQGKGSRFTLTLPEASSARTD